MPNVLCITVRFLDPVPTFHGKRDGDTPEWPPSPLRVFQALVDAAASRWQGSQFNLQARPALEWLQSLRASVIVAPAHHVGLPFRLSVPNNDLDSPASVWASGGEPVKPHRPVDLRTMKTFQPTHIRIDDAVPADALHFLYPLAPGGCPHLEVLKFAARSVTHLGWGIDMVATDANVISEADADKLPGHRWKPVMAGGVPLRVPELGTLDDLIRKHTAFLVRVSNEGFKPVPPLTAFRVVGYRRTTDVPGRPHVAFKLLHPEHDRWALFSLTSANCVAAMTRHATAAAAMGRPTDWIDSYVHGHRVLGEDSKPRFSYLPLPTIEQRGQNGCTLGGIRRVLLAELIETTPGHLTWARQLMSGQFLIDHQTGDRRAMVAPLNSADWVLRQYNKSSDTWATVTPVVLPGSDDGKINKAEKLIKKALSHAGYASEAIAELDFRNVSFWPGGDLALRYKRPDYLRQGNWSVYHMRIRWKDPINGPLALGAGRHCGLGIFAAFG